MLLIGVVIPFIYECINIYMVGWVKYLSIKENYLDLAFLGFGSANAIDHYLHSPFAI